MSKESLPRWAGWSTIIQTVFAALTFLIYLLLFIDPKSRAVEWIPTMDHTYLQLALFLLFGLAIFVMLRRVGVIERSLMEILQNAKQSGSALAVVSHGTEIVSVRLGEREFDFGPGAYEYFERRSASDREKILREIRRNNKTRWNKEHFEMLVDEKRRAHIRIDQFLASARSIKQQIESERDRRIREPKVDLVSLANDTLGLGLSPSADYEVVRLAFDFQMWKREVYEFLQKEVRGHAEEFRRDIPPPTQETDQLGLLLHSMGVLEERLVQIKSRVP